MLEATVALPPSMPGRIMPRRRTGARALKTWTSIMRAAFRLAGTLPAAGKRLDAAASKKTKAGTQGKARHAKTAKPSSVSVESSPASSKKASAVPVPGAVVTGHFRNAFGTRAYRLHVPRTPSAAGTRPPLVVMLHGCAQDAERFASATRMADHAEAGGCWMLFPEQSAAANRHRCWNWFEPEHQRRGAGEPALLAGMVGKLVRLHRLDPRRVFVAGLSAGGAMAVVLGRTYPDLFAGVGASAGMPYAAARTATTALMAMRGRHRPETVEDIAGVAAQPMRTVVIQGDRDRTVVPRNADAIAAAALDEFGPTTAVQEAGSAGGRAFTRIRYLTTTGLVAVERWTIHGARHGWSGGAPDAFSEPLGPDASRVLLDFFLGSG